VKRKQKSASEKDFFEKFSKELKVISKLRKTICVGVKGADTAGTPLKSDSPGT